jgi:hypothetical protein
MPPVDADVPSSEPLAIAAPFFANRRVKLPQKIPLRDAARAIAAGSSPRRGPEHTGELP